MTVQSQVTTFRRMMALPYSEPKSRFRAWANSAWPAFNEVMDRYSAYAATFGYVRGASLFLASRKAFKRGKRTEVMVPGTHIPLTLRLGTSDISVFQHVFVNLEYGWVFNTSPKVIVDVGGYTGLSAAFFAHAYPDATIIAVEPDAQNFELLIRNTARFPNVHALCAAVWEKSGTISLTDPGVGAWGLQVMEPNDHREDSKLVRAVTVDEIKQEFNLDRIDLL